MEVPILKLSNGSIIPQIGLGTWNLKGQECIKAVQTALKLGYNHIDTAVAYGNHVEIGQAIKGHDRKKLFITSKIWPNRLAYEEVLREVGTILQELDTQYLDLLLIHWPNFHQDYKETFRAFKFLIDEEKVKSIGISNHGPKGIQKAIDASEIPIVINQVEMHPFMHQEEVRKYCKKHDIIVTAYSPLGHGRVPSDSTLSELAKKYKATASQVALAWLLSKGVVVIPKATSETHLRENLEAINLKLNQFELELIDALPEQRIFSPGFSDFS
ncbi:MAG: aldo/keto reductase [Candidatus Woesearchaeota archaeon]